MQIGCLQSVPITSYMSTHLSSYLIYIHINIYVLSSYPASPSWDVCICSRVSTNCKLAITVILGFSSISTSISGQYDSRPISDTLSDTPLVATSTALQSMKQASCQLNHACERLNGNEIYCRKLRKAAPPIFSFACPTP